MGVKWLHFITLYMLAGHGSFGLDVYISSGMHDRKGNDNHYWQDVFVKAIKLTCVQLYINTLHEANTSTGLWRCIRLQENVKQQHGSRFIGVINLMSCTITSAITGRATTIYILFLYLYVLLLILLLLFLLLFFIITIVIIMIGALCYNGTHDTIKSWALHIQWQNSSIMTLLHQ